MTVNQMSLSQRPPAKRVAWNVCSRISSSPAAGRKNKNTSVFQSLTVATGGIASGFGTTNETATFKPIVSIAAGSGTTDQKKKNFFNKTATTVDFSAYRRLEQNTASDIHLSKYKKNLKIP